MSLLLDALEDGGLDRETIRFLVEALCNAEPPDWGDVIGGFLSGEYGQKALRVLESQPAELQRTVKALEIEAVAEAEEAAKPPPNSDSRFLDIFVIGMQGLEDDLENSGTPTKGKVKQDGTPFPGLLAFVDVNLLARCARLCPRARELVAKEHVWEHRARALSEIWHVPYKQEGSWREKFFSTLRPRCDGIYIGRCRYVHHILPGGTLTNGYMKKNYHWVEYYRYVRLLPPDSEDGELLALVLRDACTFGMAEDALLSVDPRTQKNILESQAENETIGQRGRGQHVPVAQATPEMIRSRVCAGTYTYEMFQDEATKIWKIRMVIKWSIGSDLWNMHVELSHGLPDTFPEYFSSRLEWVKYTKTSANGEVLPFNLGRSRFDRGSPADPQKDHFPAFDFKSRPALEHLL